MLVVGSIVKSIDPRIQKTIGKGKTKRHVLLNNSLKEFDLVNKSLVLDMEKKVIYKYIEVDKKHEKYNYLIYKMKLGDSRPLIVYATYDASQVNSSEKITPPITKKRSPNKRINFNYNYTYFDIGKSTLVKMDKSDEIVKELEKLARLQKQHKELADQISDDKRTMYKSKLEKTVHEYEEKIASYKKELMKLVQQMQIEKEKDIQEIVSKARHEQDDVKSKPEREDNIVQ